MRKYDAHRMLERACIRLECSTQEDGWTNDLQDAWKILNDLSIILKREAHHEMRNDIFTDAKGEIIPAWLAGQ